MPDYIIVGAGSAGCVLANRLSENSERTVLLLEAGPPDDNPEIHDPGKFTDLFYTDVAYQYFTEEQPHLTSGRVQPRGGRPMFWPRGKTLGGSSSINASIYIRGNHRDYDQWNYLGNEGWSYKDVLPFFRKSENNQRGANEYHGAGGLLDVTDLNQPNPVSLAFVETALAVGYPPNNDFNGEHQHGAGLFQVTVKDGKRVSTATAFLDPARNRPNLTVQTGARARRLLFEGTRAIGVEYEMQLGPMRLIKQAKADQEVIVSCGTVDSPKLLMLSGIGQAEELERLGIPVLVNLPGVGQNLQDHLLIALGFRYADGKPSARPAAGSGEGCLFTRTRPGVEEAAPDLQIHFVHYLFPDPSYTDPLLPPPMGFTFWPTLVTPQSRGCIGLRSSNPTDSAVIKPNYLESDTDVQVLVEGFKICRDLAYRTPFDPFRGEEVAPGPEVRSDQEIRAYTRLACTTLFHPVGTCKMGRDRMAVVDAKAQVYGVQGLRVVDASIMPVIPAGNTNAGTIMVAEKVAAMMSNSESH